MIPIKILCGCGQKYAFETEPVDGRMATAIHCPACGVDGTDAANTVISQTVAMPAPAPVAPSINRLRTAAAPERITPPTLPPATIAPIPQYGVAKAVDEFNMGKGILGAIIGALIGGGAMFAFYVFVGFRFPLLGVGIGALTGYGARFLYKGTDTTLGVISGAIALVTVVGILFLMYGTFPMLSIISVAVSVSVAYRISSG